MFYALSHKTEGRLAAAMPGSGQQEHGPIKRKKGHTEVYEQISGDNTEQYGTGTQRPSGSLPVPRKWQDICLSSCGDVTESDDERTGRKERPDEDLNDGVRGHRASKTQVSHIALQTDTCDTLYVTL